MSFMQELKSWTYGMTVDVKELPTVGAIAPSSDKLRFPRPDNKPTVVTFLRHCGCPFAERDFLSLRDIAAKHPDVTFIAVSHSSENSTAKWLQEVGGKGDATVVVDDSRQLHADWGLGPSGWTHVLSPTGFSELYKLGRSKGIWNRPTESGSRWQTAGSFAVASDGKVTWAQKPDGAQEEPDFEKGVKSLRA